jgi:hypothetical protein
MRKVSEFLKRKVAEWLVRRYLKRLKLSNPQTLQIEELERQLAELRLMQAKMPNVYDRLAEIHRERPVSMDIPEPEPEVAAPVEETAADEPTPETFDMTTSDVPAAVQSAPATSSSLPDVKLLAPILKIALTVLTPEQMVEIFLHVKMGAPGLAQFLDSETARTQFKTLYSSYCEFLAGKTK